MTIVYSHNEAVGIQDMLQAGKITTLDIHYDDSLGEENAAYVMVFTTVEDEPSDEQSSIRSIFDTNIQLLIKVVKELSEFITMMDLNNVEKYRLKFNIKEAELTISKKFGSKKIETTDCSNALEMYEQSIIDSGNIDSKCGVYEKLPPTNGSKRPRYEQLTFGQLIDKLKNL